MSNPPDDPRMNLAAGAWPVWPVSLLVSSARLLIELKSRLDLPDLSLDHSGAALHGGDAAARGSRTSRAEARAALSELGYAPDEIRGALDGLRDDVGVEEMLRLALRELASR